MIEGWSKLVSEQRSFLTRLVFLNNQLTQYTVALLFARRYVFTLMYAIFSDMIIQLLWERQPCPRFAEHTTMDSPSCRCHSRHNDNYKVQYGFLMKLEIWVHILLTRLDLSHWWRMLCENVLQVFDRYYKQKNILGLIFGDVAAIYE